MHVCIYKRTLCKQNRDRDNGNSGSSQKLIFRGAHTLECRGKEIPTIEGNPLF